MGYALWLVPSKEESSTLCELMKFRPEQSMTGPQSKSYPSFHPHITLATFKKYHDLKLETLVPQDGYVYTHFLEMSRGRTYLGALKFWMDENRDLKLLHDEITYRLDDLGIQWQSSGFPHMSLFYVEEAQERENLERWLLEDIVKKDKRDKNRILLMVDKKPLRSFTGAEVWLVDCTSAKVEEWKMLKKLSLRKDNHDTFQDTEQKRQQSSSMSHHSASRLTKAPCQVSTVPQTPVPSPIANLAVVKASNYGSKLEYHTPTIQPRYSATTPSSSSYDSTIATALALKPTSTQVRFAPTTGDKAYASKLWINPGGVHQWTNFTDWQQSHQRI